MQQLERDMGLFIDSVSYFSQFTETTFQSPNANMATFIILSHPVTILATVFTKTDNLINDLLILCHPSIDSAQVANQQKKCSTLKEPSMNRKGLRVLTQNQTPLLYYTLTTGYLSNKVSRISPCLGLVQTVTVMSLIFTYFIKINN